MKKYKIIFGFLFSIVLIFSLYGFASKRHASRTVKNVKVSFVEYYEPIISEKIVNKLLIQNTSNIQNTPLEKLDLNESELRLIKNPMVRHAEVSLSLDGTLQAVVEPRKAVARIVGTPDFYLDADNTFMKLSQEHTVLVPLVYGFKKSYKDPLFKLIKTINNDAFLKAAVTQIVFDASGAINMQVRVYEYDILLGDVENLAHKLSNYKAFVAKTIKDQNLDNIKTIDLRYKNQVVVVKK